MGIVNVTPDSFSDGGENVDSADAIATSLRLLDEGAALVDVGGESTRPGADDVSLDEELRRVIPVLEGLLAIRFRSTRPRRRSRAGHSRSVCASSTTSLLCERTRV